MNIYHYLVQPADVNFSHTHFTICSHYLGI